MLCLIEHTYKPRSKSTQSEQNYSQPIELKAQVKSKVDKGHICHHMRKICYTEETTVERLHSREIQKQKVVTTSAESFDLALHGITSLLL